MNYIQVYNKLIQKRLENPLDKSNTYTECHHIIPKCMGGGDNKDNLVCLTAREHYIAHVLLAKAYNSYKLYYAVVKMRVQSHNHSRDFHFNSRLYEQIRTACYKEQALYRKQHPLKSWNKGKSGVYSAETLRKMSDSAKQRKPRHFSEQARKNMSLAHKGKPNGKKGIKLSPEHVQKVREKNLGKHWFNNGCNEIKAYSCPDGYVKGRLKQTT